MKKSLELIQSENRRFIVFNVDDFESSLLNLDRVLLALKYKEIGFIDEGLFEVIEDNGYYREEHNIQICKWDLTKPTLEEQSEETQRAINKLSGE